MLVGSRRVDKMNTFEFQLRLTFVFFESSALIVISIILSPFLHVGSVVRLKKPETEYLECCVYSGFWKVVSLLTL